MASRYHVIVYWSDSVILQSLFNYRYWCLPEKVLEAILIKVKFLNDHKYRVSSLLDHFFIYTLISWIRLIAMIVLIELIVGLELENYVLNFIIII